MSNSGCGKRRLSEREARSEARRVSVSIREEVRAYRCDFCSFWHVGHAVARRLR